VREFGNDVVEKEIDDTLKRETDDALAVYELPVR
jgi:hypothetical protein